MLVQYYVQGIFPGAFGEPIVVIKDKEGKNYLPIGIDHNMASLMLRELNNMKNFRPLTHDIILSVIDKAGAQIKKMVINDLKDNAFHAQLVIEKN